MTGLVPSTPVGLGWGHPVPQPPMGGSCTEGEKKHFEYCKGEHVNVSTEVREKGLSIIVVNTGT